MERNFYTDDFEHILKENADQFKMTPSKKVWHGIYNDIHPGRRWPSIAMSLLFVFTLVLVGHLNTQQSRHSFLADTKKSAEPQTLFSQTVNKTSGKKSSTTSSHKNIAITNETMIISAGKNKQLSNKETGENLKASSNSVTTVKEKEADKENTTQPKSGEDLLFTAKTESKSLAGNTLTDLKNINNSQPDVAQIVTAEVTLLNQENASTEILSTEPVMANYQMIKNTVSASVSNVNPAKKERKNNVTARVHLKPHRNQKISWAYYISPNISYRVYTNHDNTGDQNFLGSINSSTYAGYNRTVTHQPLPGLEAGTSIKYSLTKKLKLTSGLQVNYSAYSIQANNIHPIMATLILHDEKTALPYAISSISYFGNGPGNVPVNLHNYSVQLSVPVGLEYKLAGNDHVQLSAVGSFQPSLVIANQAYILSTDKRNYLTDASLTRVWNMGTNIGTLVTFNSNKFKWQIGPQVHYNLLSAYKNEYYVREHFIDYGIRLGISNILR